MPLPDVDQFMGQQQALSVVDDVGGEKDMATQRDADVGAGKLRDLVHPHPCGQSPRDESVTIEFEWVQWATGHTMKLAPSGLRWWCDRRSCLPSDRA